MAGEKEMEADAGGDRHLQFRVLESFSGLRL